MPYKFEKIPINNEKLDKRVKLTEADKENIKKEYETGTIGINALARKYGVSKRLIQFTLFPERKEQAKKAFAERRKDGRYYDKDKQREYQRKHRSHKKELYDKGHLKEGNNDLS
jgi:transposase-like protein